MKKGFEIEFSFVEKWGRLAKAEYLRVYIYALSNFKKSGVVMSPQEISKKLHIGCDEVLDAIDFWITAEVLKEDAAGYAFGDEKEASFETVKTQPLKAHLRKRPSYTAAEIDAAASVNENVDYLLRQAEEILGKLLSPSDFELIYSFVDWLGLPVEVVIMLLRFAKAQGKLGKRYLETVAIDWAEKGIDTYESAEEYIKEIEQRLSNEGKIRGILGIYDRALSQTEKKYINLWTAEKGVPLELIREAYDRTVAATGKLAWAYMNKILSGWQEEGVETLKQLEEYEKTHKPQSVPAKGKAGARKGINNYKDTNKPDYSNFAEEILNEMLEG
ncbi:MAG: DnaD domain protein [Clostridia bacterium]|nr:DnaD domain protein [Clostridia bacterium]